MTTPIELLARVQVASPCTADWGEMHGDDRIRFCRQCAKNVYNLSALTADQAVALMREREGDLCGRFFRRADGTVLTADCPVGVHHRVKRRRRLAALAATLGGLLSFTGPADADEKLPVAAPQPVLVTPKFEVPKQLLPLSAQPTMGRILLPRPTKIVLSEPKTSPELLPPPREVKPLE